MKKKIFFLSIFVFFLTQIQPLISEIPNIYCDMKGTGFECFGTEISKALLFAIKGIVIVIIVFLYTVIHYFQVFKPIQRYEESRKNIFNLVLAKSLDEWINKGFSLRINVMKARRPLRCFGLFYKLEPIYHYGFADEDRDSHLSFWVSNVFKWAQGNSGEAFLSGELQFADLREKNPLYDYNLSNSKITATNYIKGIISIPVYQKLKTGIKPKILGVINIDTNDVSLVEEWEKDESCLLDFCNRFKEHAKIVSFYI